MVSKNYTYLKEYEESRKHNTQEHYIWNHKILTLLCVVGYFIFPRLGYRQTLRLPGQDALTYVSHKTNR